MIYIAHAPSGSMFKNIPKFVVLENIDLDIELLREEYDREFNAHIIVNKQYREKKKKIESQLSGFSWGGPVPNGKGIDYMSGNPTSEILKQAEELEKWYQVAYNKAVEESESKKSYLEPYGNVEFGFTKWLIEYKEFRIIGHKSFQDFLVEYC